MIEITVRPDHVTVKLYYGVKMPYSITITAEKDKLETISESGVLFERGEYDKVPDAARRLMESVFGGKYG